jgi:hypothetical protein
MERSDSSIYVDPQVQDRLNGVSAHLVDLGFKQGELDPGDINPDYDFRIDEDLSEYSFREGADPYPVVDVLSESFLSGIKMDTDRGYFEFETESGDTSEGWMPYLDEGKAEGIFCIEHPWTGEPRLGAYDGKEEIGEDFSGIEPMLESAYRTAREHVPDKGQRNTDNSMTDYQSQLSKFKDTIAELESEGAEDGVDPGQHSGQLRGRDIVGVFSGAMDRARKANLVDYPVSNQFGQHSFARTAGGYKNLTEFPESAPYDSMEEAIEFRYPDSWLEKEQS